MLYFWIGLGICLGLAILAVFLWCQNNVISKTCCIYEKDGADREITLVHLSDLHGKSFGKDNCKLVKEVSALNPDIIAITGDIIHKYTPKDKRVALRLVSELSALCRVVYVAGNHEMRNKGYRFFRRDLKEAGAVVLDDCAQDICGLTLVGLNCASQKNGKINKITPQQTVAGRLKILLAHKPHLCENYKGLGYDLILSGHAHGGQWRIPFTNQGIFAPGQGMFPKLTSGMHTVGESKLIISRGLGNSQCPVRLFNRPEIVLVKIVPKK